MRDEQYSTSQIITLVTITLIGILLSVSLNKPLVIGFLPGFIVLIMMIRGKGISVREIQKTCWGGVRKTSGVIYILLLVSLLLPSWYLSGTINQLVAIALNAITPEHYFLLSFLATTVFSMILGTSVGTLSAIGIPIMSGASALGLPVEIVAGAIISGAFVGDRTSPFSSAFQLVAHTVETTVKQQFKVFFTSSIIAIICGGVFFTVLDTVYSKHVIQSEEVIPLGELSLLKFLPPVILIVFVLLRIKIIYAFLGSIMMASILALYSGVGKFTLIQALWSGTEEIGGGFVSMYLLLAFLAIAGAYNGLLEKHRVIQPILDRWLQTSANLVGDTFKVMFATFGISLIAANQTLPIILTGRSFLSYWSGKYSKEELARVMGDTTMLFPGIIPWSVLAIMCSTVVGVSIFSYLPYAIFLWILPFITILVSIRKQKRIVRAVVLEGINK